MVKGTRTMAKQPTAHRLKKRMMSIKKKSMELSTLCGVDVGFVCVGKDGKLETWPENPHQLKPILAKYMKQRSRTKKKMEMSSKSGLLFSPSRMTTLIDGLSKPSLQNFFDLIDAKLKLINEKINSLTNKHQSQSHSNPLINPNDPDSSVFFNDQISLQLSDHQMLYFSEADLNPFENSVFLAQDSAFLAPDSAFLAQDSAFLAQDSITPCDPVFSNFFSDQPYLPPSDNQMIDFNDDHFNSWNFKNSALLATQESITQSDSIFLNDQSFLPPINHQMLDIDPNAFDVQNSELLATQGLITHSEPMAFTHNQVADQLQDDWPSTDFDSMIEKLDWASLYNMMS